MGLSSSKSKSSTTQTQNTQPTIPSWIQGPYSQYFGQIANASGLDPSQGFVGASPLQQQAFQGAQHLMGPNEGINAGLDATQGLLDFRQKGINTSRPKFDASTGLDKFMNPFQQSVIDATTQNLERSRDQAITEGQAAATQAGAFGGSRHGVADALTNREFFDSLGATTAGLNAANFGQAQASRQSEVERALNTAMFNRDMGQQNAQFRGAMANQLFGQGVTQDANERANLGLLSDLGAQQRGINQESNPYNQQMMHLARIGALFGINPAMFAGQTSTGTSNTTGKQGTSGLDWLNGFANLWGSANGG